MSLSQFSHALDQAVASTGRSYPPGPRHACYDPPPAAGWHLIGAMEQHLRETYQDADPALLNDMCHKFVWFLAGEESKIDDSDARMTLSPRTAQRELLSALNAGGLNPFEGVCVYDIGAGSARDGAHSRFPLLTLMDYVAHPDPSSWDSGADLSPHDPVYVSLEHLGSLDGVINDAFAEAGIARRPITYVVGQNLINHASVDRLSLGDGESARREKQCANVMSAVAHVASDNGASQIILATCYPDGASCLLNAGLHDAMGLRMSHHTTAPSRGGEPYGIMAYDVAKAPSITSDNFDSIYAGSVPSTVVSPDRTRLTTPPQVQQTFMQGM